jgi:hypothetical protein
MRFLRGLAAAMPDLEIVDLRELLERRGGDAGGRSTVDAVEASGAGVRRGQRTGLGDAVRGKQQVSGVERDAAGELGTTDKAAEDLAVGSALSGTLPSE